MHTGFVFFVRIGVNKDGKGCGRQFVIIKLIDSFSSKDSECLIQLIKVRLISSKRTRGNDLFPGWRNALNRYAGVATKLLVHPLAVNT